VQFPTADGMVRAVQGLSYSLPLGRTLAIVGESGSGKSVSSMAVMGLHDARVARISGSIRVGDKQIVGMGEDEMKSYRGVDAAMIFQDPQSSLHPFFTVGDQIMEMYRRTTGSPKARPRNARSTCSAGSASRTRNGGSTITRTSSPAACASAP
jgi:peptide/nickel transport system ATP-binding protein